MRDITLSVAEEEYPGFIRLIKKLDYVKVKKTSKTESSKQIFLNGFKEAIEELNMIKAGKMQGIPAKDLLNGL